jgi:hypothetical protein
MHSPRNFGRSLIVTMVLAVQSLTTSAQGSSTSTVLLLPVDGPMVGNYTRATTRDWTGIYCTGLNTPEARCLAQPTVALIQRTMEFSYTADVADTPSSTLTFLPANPMFLLFRPVLPRGPVPVAQVGAATREGRQLRHPIQFRGQTWELRLPNYAIEGLSGDAVDDAERLACRPGRVFVIELQHSQTALRWKRALCDEPTNGMAEGGAKPVWIGDVDGDGLPDVLLDLPSHPQAGTHMLLLSSDPERKIAFVYDRPGNPGC